jgi:zinc protease
MPTTHAGLEPIRTALSNGVVVIVKETRKTPAVTLNLALKAGSIADPIQTPGAVHLLSRVVDRGTATRSTVEIADQLDRRGVSLTAAVSRHVFSLSCTCLADDFDEILDLVGDVVMSPRIPEAELARRRGEVVTSIRQDEDNPAVRANEGVMALLYGSDHPYGRPYKGTAEAIERISRDDLLRLHADRFAPSVLTAVVVGDVAVTHAVEAVSRVFGDWRTAAAAPLSVPPVPWATERQVRVLRMANKAQADIAYAFTTITRADEAYYALSLLNNALGQYALGGRLGDSIRERQGMAYYVSSTFNANVAEGPLTIRAGVSGANVDRTIRSIDDELGRLLADGLTEQELIESRQYLIGSLPRALETNGAIAEFLQTAEFFDLGLDFDRRLPELLRAVTLDQTTGLARRYLDPQRASIVIAGPV